LLSPTALYGYRTGAFGLPAVLTSALPARITIPRQAQALLYPLLVALSRLSERLQRGQPERMIERPAARATSNSPVDYVYATTHQFGAEHAPMDLLAGNLAGDISADIQKLRQPILLIWGTGELHYARQEPAAPGSAAIEEVEIGSATTRIILLQRTSAAIHRELPETVVKTILQWSAEPAISEAKTSTTNNLSQAYDVAGTPDTTLNEPSGTVKPQFEAYCMKCKEKRGILNPREVTMKNGRLAMQGECEVCGASLFRMGRLAPGSPQTPV
jgi:hypothetical protein